MSTRSRYQPDDLPLWQLRENLIDLESELSATDDDDRDRLDELIALVVATRGALERRERAA